MKLWIHILESLNIFVATKSYFMALDEHWRMVKFYIYIYIYI